MHLSLASGSKVDVGGLAVDALADRRSRLALAVLVLERHRPVSRHELAEIVWPEGPPPTWESALRTVVSRVRTFLSGAGIPADALFSRAGCYELRLPPDVEVDVEVRTAQVRAAEDALRRDDAVRALDLLGSAADVLARPLLPGVDTPWADRRRDEIRALLVRALEAEAQARVRCGEPARAVEALERALDLEPLHESAHRALMAAQAAAGNRGEALRAYERCRRLLVDEVGVDPAPATEALYLSILREEAIPAMTGGGPQSFSGTAEGALERGRAALRRRAWEEAFAALSSADAVHPLDAPDLDALGEAAMWTGRHEEAIVARRRAHVAYLAAGNRVAAAQVAMTLVANHAIRLQLAAAEGWFRTAAGLLDGEPEGPPQGFLAFLAAVMALDTGDVDGCLEAARGAADVGRRFGIPDLEALGATFQGCALVRQQRLREGLALLDEGMARATTGRLSPLACGLIYCRTIWTCVELCDHRRAAEWIEQVEASSLQTGFRGYAGDCDAHRAAVLAVRGSWAEAEREAERACDECRTFDVSHVGLASYTLGLVRLRRGDLDGAEAAFQQANERGTAPQPGLALLHLARADVAGAGASIRTALDLAPPAGLARARLLPALVETALAAGDVDAVETAADELEQVALAYPVPAHAASLALARGVVSHLRGDARGAARQLTEAVHRHVEAEAPYDAARARLHLATALEEVGDPAGAVLELQTARSVFERLGARLDAFRVAKRLTALQVSSPKQG